MLPASYGLSGDGLDSSVIQKSSLSQSWPHCPASALGRFGGTPFWVRRGEAHLQATRVQGFVISTCPMASQLQVLSPHEFDRPASFQIRQEHKLNGNLICIVIYCLHKRLGLNRNRGCKRSTPLCIHHEMKGLQSTFILLERTV
jgi:hypothetical protein